MHCEPEPYCCWDHPNGLACSTPRNSGLINTYIAKCVEAQSLNFCRSSISMSAIVFSVGPPTTAYNNVALNYNKHRRNFCTWRWWLLKVVVAVTVTTTFYRCMLLAMERSCRRLTSVSPSVCLSVCLWRWWFLITYVELGGILLHG